MIRNLEVISRLRATPSHHQVARMVLKRQRHLVAPHHVHHPSCQQGNQHLTSLKLGIVWKYRWSLPKTGEWHHHPTCLASASCGRHGLRWQIQPNASSSDQPKSDLPVLWAVISRRRTEPGWDVGHCIHAVRGHWLGWQTSLTQSQSSKPGWRLVVDCPSHHWKTHWTKRTWMSLLHSNCINTI